MSLHALLFAAQKLPLAIAMAGGVPELAWLFAAIETLHVLALALAFGSIALLDLRLLGWRSLDSPVSSLARATLPVTWIAWLCAAATGSLLFMSKAVTYAGNLQFQLKLLAMALAATNMLAFHYGPYRSVGDWDNAHTPPGAARLAGALSLLLWTAVVFLGRWVGFTT